MLGHCCCGRAASATTVAVIAGGAACGFVRTDRLVVDIIVVINEYVCLWRMRLCIESNYIINIARLTKNDIIYTNIMHAEYNFLYSDLAGPGQSTKHFISNGFVFSHSLCRVLQCICCKTHSVSNLQFHFHFNFDHLVVLIFNFTFDSPFAHFMVRSKADYVNFFEINS